METKQTAIEWFSNMLKNEEIIRFHGLFEYYYIKAKEMEKRQLEDTWEIGSYSLLDNSNGLDFEQYYNETYGKEET